MIVEGSQELEELWKRWVEEQVERGFATFKVQAPAALCKEMAAILGVSDPSTPGGDEGMGCQIQEDLNKFYKALATPRMIVNVGPGYQAAGRKGEGEGGKGKGPPPPAEGGKGKGAPPPAEGGKGKGPPPPPPKGGKGAPPAAPGDAPP